MLDVQREARWQGYSSIGRRRRMRSTRRCSSASRKRSSLRGEAALRAVVLGGHGKRLQGAVFGAGLELAAACDLRIAACGTRFAMPEVRLGIPSVVGAALLPRLVGSGRAAWLVLTGEEIDTQRAHEWGFVEQACPAGALDDTVKRVLEALLAGNREALRMQKALLQLWEEQPLSASVAASVDMFCEAHRHRSRGRNTIRGSE